MGGCLESVRRQPWLSPMRRRFTTGGTPPSILVRSRKTGALGEPAPGSGHSPVQADRAVDGKAPDFQAFRLQGGPEGPPCWYHVSSVTP
jgi:hypothetical protein